MMNNRTPIPSTADMRKWDAYTIAHEPIASIDLMERAAMALFTALKNDYNLAKGVVVICGRGNNGGDGLALARLLKNDGFPVRCILAVGTDNLSPEAAINLQRLQEAGVEVESSGSRNVSLNREHLIIDALFGTGINRPLEDDAMRWTQLISFSSNRVISIDIPSGLPADLLPDLEDYPSVSASKTYTFQLLKPSFLVSEGAERAGQIEVLDIGLHPDFLNVTSFDKFLLDKKLAASILQRRPEFSHKGNFGKCLIIAGSRQYAGAAMLAAKAALHSGAGLVALHSSPWVRLSAIAAMPELTACLSLSEINRYDSVCIGPGLGQSDEAVKILDFVLGEAPLKLILDADALNIIAAKGWTNRIPSDTLITPHPEEFKRLTGISKNRVMQIEAMLEICYNLRITIVLKGKYSAIGTLAGEVYFNTSGNTALAKGGSGDVLAGLIAGLMAQGYKVKNAAMLGVWLHGRSADLALENPLYSPETLQPSELCTYFGQAFNELRDNI